jgi:hypothetical protein
VAWFWKSKRGVSEPKPAKLSYTQIQRLNTLGDDLTKFLAQGQRVKGAVPTKLMEEATRGELRAALIEYLMVLLQKGLPFKMQIQGMEQVAMLFVFMKFFDIPAGGGTREIEPDETYKKALGLWDEFQTLVTKDDGRRFEINEEEIREKVVVKLIEQTK